MLEKSRKMHFILLLRSINPRKEKIKQNIIKTVVKYSQIAIKKRSQLASRLQYPNKNKTNYMKSPKEKYCFFRVKIK